MVGNSVSIYSFTSLAPALERGRVRGEKVVAAFRLRYRFSFYLTFNKRGREGN
jgi:hypothetical protein